MRPKWFQADPKSRYHRQSQWYQEGTWNGPENQTMSGKALAANPGSKPKATRPSLANPSSVGSFPRIGTNKKMFRLWYMASKRPGSALDPALLVSPPKGLEVGYVPIVTHQEVAPD
jgi:hypothetical protein